MSLSSMTGFARAAGAAGSASWTWELRSVNAKGLDLRLRLPPGFDAVEAEARAIVAKHVNRGAIQATLDLARSATAPNVRLDRPLLAELSRTVVATCTELGLPPPSTDTLLAIRGVIEITGAEDDPETRAALEAALANTLAVASRHLAEARLEEGRALETVLVERLDRLTACVEAAERTPAREPSAVRARVAAQIALIADEKLDVQRLHQEAVLLAIRADVSEELDRLRAHIGAARSMLAEGGVIGRRLDFLSQELNREANTVCSKSSDVALTALGLEMKSLVEQFREQVQNVE